MIISGKKISDAILFDLEKKIGSLATKPCLAVVLVGENGASLAYVRAKRRAAEKIGMDFRLVALPDTTREEALLEEIRKLNAEKAVSGCIVQLPLPAPIDKDRVIATIDPKKDVDGFTPTNVGELFLDHECLPSCTPKGIVRLLDISEIPLVGKHVVVIGKSNIVGKPLALLLMNRGATVTVCHKETPDLAIFTKLADIVVVAVGRPGLLTMEMLRPGCVVIDVGITVVDGKIRGDADFASIEPHCPITPVPGGVGPMTVAMLLENTYLAAVRQNS